MKAFEDWSYEDVLKHNARIKKQTTRDMPKEEKQIVGQSRSKYGNTKTVINGIKYDSKKEAKRAAELEVQERLGLISNLERQKKYTLQPSFKFMGKTIREISYVADFVYMENGTLVVEDVKSPATRINPVYKIKKKMLMYVHGIEIREV